VKQDCECKWIWTRWSKCTAECGGGNTTRIPECNCNGELTENKKCDVNYYYGRETVGCNEYKCGNIPALNKLYWMSETDTNSWPMENSKFNCSLGEDPEDSPKGKTYYEVLSEPRPSTHKNAAWYSLAKEWITALLNIANGAQFPSDGVKVVIEVGKMLEQCGGFSDGQLPEIYASKEKLGRLNNNIGGLQNVDDQMTLMRGNENLDSDARSSRLTFILAIAVPLGAVLLVAVALAFTIYYVRQKTSVAAKDKFESEDEEEPLQTTDGNPTAQTEQVPLEMEPLPPAKEDSSSEER